MVKKKIAVDASLAASSPSPSPRTGGERDSLARALLRSVPALLVPGLIVLDTAVAALRGWKPLVPSERWVPLAAGILGLVVLALALVPRLRRAHRWLTPRLAAVLIGPFALVLAAEAWFRHTAPGFHLRPPGTHMVFDVPPGILPGISGATDFTINSHGYRGPDLPADHTAYRIFCIGGSTTESLYQDDTECWPQLVMDRLDRRAGARPAWVASSGISGFATRHHLRFVETSPLLDHVDCLLLLVGVNDLQEGLKGDRVHPRWTRSAVLRKARSLFLHGVGADMRIEDRTATGYPRRRALRQRAPKVALPDLAEPLHEFTSNVERIVAVLRRRGVRPIFLTQPVLWRADLPEEERRLLWFGGTKDTTYVDVAGLREGMDLYNEALRATCRRLGADCIDLDSLNGRPELFFDDCHYSLAGAHAVADTVTGWLERNWDRLAGPPSGAGALASGAR